MTGSDGVSFLLPQLFLSQHRLQGGERRGGQRQRGVSHRDVNHREIKIRYITERGRGSQRSVQERERGVKGRETLAEFQKQRELDFCWASRGKTGALALQ